MTNGRNNIKLARIFHPKEIQKPARCYNYTFILQIMDICNIFNHFYSKIWIIYPIFAVKLQTDVPHWMGQTKNHTAPFCRIFKHTGLNLIIDIGNNSAKFFLFKGEQIILHTRKSNSSFDVIDEWSSQYDIEKAIISSVIAESAALQSAISRLKCPVIRFCNTMPLPIEIGYRTPQTLGSDRIAAAVGAWSAAPGRNIMVIDAGSAITVDFIDRNGKYHGGNIAPGIKMRLKALHEYTDRLPMVEKEGDTPTIGYDTETAIRSGVMNGICHEMDGYINEFKQKYCDVLVFLTGGDEKPLKNRIKNCIFADKYLVAKGLNRILTDYVNE